MIMHQKTYTVRLTARFQQTGSTGLEVVSKIQNHFNEIFFDCRFSWIHASGEQDIKCNFNKTTQFLRSFTLQDEMH